MHGLVNRAVQSFVCHTYGALTWAKAMKNAGLGFGEFEAMLRYEASALDRVLTALCNDLGRARAEFLEDLGTFLVSDPNLEGLRRLLRFGGTDYVEFLHSLDDLPGRARLAVPDLHLPGLELFDAGGDEYRLTCKTGLPGFGSVMLGVLRTMADDYGVLATLHHRQLPDGGEEIDITLIEIAFAEGRSFVLGQVSE